MPKVLLVDDEQDFVEFLRPSLEELGVEVVTALSGEDALNIVREQAPDILVTDLVMPEMNGIQLIEAVNGKRRNIPVITISGYPDWDEKLKQISDLVNVSLLKPIRLDDVVASVDICLNTLDKSS